MTSLTALVAMASLAACHRPEADAAERSASANTRAQAAGWSFLDARTLAGKADVPFDRNDFEAMAVDVATGALLVATQRGLLRSTDGGRTYAPVALPGATQEELGRRGAAMRSTRGVTLLAWRGRFLRTSDGGATWAEVTLPEGFYSVVATDEALYAATRIGTKAQLRRSVDGDVFTPIGETLDAADDDDDGYIYGSAGAVLKLRRGDSAAVPARVKVLAEGTTETRIFKFEKNVEEMAFDGGRLFTLHDDGTLVRTDVATEARTTVGRVTYHKHAQLFARGDKLRVWAGSQLHVSDDGGATWRVLATPIPSRNLSVLEQSATLWKPINGVDTFLVASDGAGLFTTADDWATHSVLTAGYPMVDGGPVHVGPRGVLVARNDYLARTTDRGKSWTKIPHTHRTLPDAVFEDGELIAVGSGDFETIVSLDGGRTWIATPEGAPSSPDRVASFFATTTHLFAQRYDDGPLAMLDRSTGRWLSTPDTPKLAEACALADGRVVAAFEGEVGVSSDRGATWTKAPYASFGGPRSVLGVDDRLDAAVACDDRAAYLLLPGEGDSHSLFASTDGATWSRRTASPASARPRPGDLLVTSGRLFVKDVANRAVLLSDDDGATWASTGPSGVRLNNEIYLGATGACASSSSIERSPFYFGCAFAPAPAR